MTTKHVRVRKKEVPLPSPLPNDPDALRRLVEAQASELETSAAAMEKLRFERDAALKWTDILSREIDALKRSLFGKKSERFCPDQLSLDLLPAAVAGAQVAADGAEGASQDDGEAKPSGAAGDGKAAEPRVRRKKGSGARLPHGRRDLFADRADRLIICTLDNPCCDVCRGALRHIGNAVSRRIDWFPGHHEIVEVSLQKCVCPEHPGQGVVTAPAPAFALPKALCGDGLLAKVLVDKFADHIPLHRQARRFRREGLELTVSTLCGWVMAAADRARPLVLAMKEDLVKGTWAQGDATGMVVLEGHENRPHRGQLWVYGNDDHAIFEYSADGDGKKPLSFLQKFKGIWLSDGCSVYNLVCQANGLLRAGCWSHGRRKLFEARISSPEIFHAGISAIREIFMIERRAREDIELRKRLRAELVAPMVHDFFLWVHKEQETLEPDNPMMKALNYFDNQEVYLRRFLQHPEIAIHNNASELQLRQPVVGRKNWMFAGSEGGAKAAATLFSLTGSCLLQAIDPWTYLLDVLPKIADHSNSRLLELSPAGWRAARVKAP